MALKQLPAIPYDGVVGEFKDYDHENGIATFEFQKPKGAYIPQLRVYGQPMCKGDDRITMAFQLMAKCTFSTIASMAMKIKHFKIYRLSTLLIRMSITPAHTHG